MIIPPNNEADKQFRALQIVSLIKLPMNDKIVLDCGCGEGYNAAEMANSATKVVGYDPKQDPHWAGRSKDNLILTANRDTASEHAPFDLIVLYDVIDHIVGDDPADFVQWLSSQMNPGGTMFVRTHPWTSRTGGHAYEDANKAFIHLALTPDELAKSGIKVKEPNLKVVRPMAAYEQWFKDAGLEVEDKRVKTAEVEPFFSGPIMDRIIKINWGGKIDADTARKILANHFIDYTLRKA
jgi:2-polyprenyl-3-methyl-5-hydroxy-6-metoxy-1,4-benzoquinol methylase